MKRFFLVLAAVVLLASCEKEVDFGLIDEIGVSPSFTAPLVNARLTLGDLVTDEDTLLQVDPNNALRIYFRQDSIFSFNAGDLLEVPDQDPETIVLSDIQSFIQVGQSLGTIAGAELESAEFSSGQLEMDLSTSSAFNTDIDVRMTIVNGTQNGNTFTADYTLPANSTSELDSVSIADLIIDLSNNGMAVNFLEIRLEVINANDLPANSTIDCTFRFKSLNVANATGYFGNRVENITPGNFDLNINGLENFAGGFLLTNPQIELVANSNTGLPVRVNPNFQGVNIDNEREQLGAPDFDLAPAAQPGDVNTTNFTLDQSNSNIVDFLAILPQRVLYSGNAELNPDGRPTNPNFLVSDSRITMDMEVNIPLELRAQNMKLDQTITAKLAPGDNANAIEKLDLFFKTENRLPFAVDLAISFIDSTSGDSLTGFNIDLLTAAPVDANGEVTDTRTETTVVSFTDDQLEGLQKSNKIRFLARVNTANGGMQEVKLFTTNDLRIKIATSASVNYTP